LQPSLVDGVPAHLKNPVVALNRAIAVGQRDGADAGLAALVAIADKDRLDRYPFYPAALAEHELRRGDHEAASRCFRKALMLTRNDAERRFLEKRLSHVENREPAPTHGRKDNL